MTTERLLLELKAVSKSFGQTEVLQRIDLAVRDGEFITILGPSGSGKTTILRMIGGFESPSRGEILLDGADISALPINKRPFNTVFQDYALFPHMTVAANVGYGLKVRGVRQAEIDARVGEVDGEYCPGEFSINVGGTAKIVGSAQRVTATGSLFSTVVQVTVSDRVRAVIVDVSEALGYDLRHSSIAGLADHVPGLTAGEVAEAFAADYRERLGLTDGPLPA